MNSTTDLSNTGEGSNARFSVLAPLAVPLHVSRSNLDRILNYSLRVNTLAGPAIEGSTAPMRILIMRPKNSAGDIAEAVVTLTNNWGAAFSSLSWEILYDKMKWCMLVSNESGNYIKCMEVNETLIIDKIEKTRAITANYHMIFATSSVDYFITTYCFEVLSKKIN